MECETREWRTCRQGKTVEDQFYIDDDYNVPDVKSDVKRVVLGTGELDIEELKPVENYVRVSGKLNFKILYVAEEGELRLASLAGNLPFEEMVYMEEEKDFQFFVKLARADLTVTMIHSRKLNIKALAELKICPEREETIKLTTDVEAGFPIYKKYREQEILRLVAMKKDTCRIKEEASVGGTKESIGTILFTEVSSRKLDTRLAEGELLIQGELLLFCFYESLEGKSDWVEQTVPYEGRIECHGAGDHMYHQIYAELADINVEARMNEEGEMRLLGVEATLEVRLVVCGEEKVQLVEDMYSLTQELTPVYEEQQAERLLMQNHSKCKISERLSLPEIKDSILQICHSSGKIQLTRTEAAEGGIRVEGVLHVCFLYVKPDDEIPFDVWQGMVPFSWLLESNETAPDMNSDITGTVEQLAVGLLGNDEIEVKAVLSFHSFLREPVTVRGIEDIRQSPIDMEEMEKRPGIVGYIVKEGDDLWSLAKNYNTTVEGITEVNQLSSDTLETGDKLLIFKENMSIL